MEVNKKILVTGGTGFLGSYLLRYLVQKGYNNIFSIRRVTSNMDLVKSIEDKIQWVECDILDVKGLEKVMEGVKQVYHSAAMVSFETKHQKKMHLVNIQGTANVVNLALENNIEKLVHVSSIAALGRRKRLKEINENTKWEKSNFNSEYAKSKYLSEQEVWRGMAEGLRACVINPAIILGAGFWEEGSSSFFSKIKKGNKFYGVGGTGFVDVRDVSRLMIEMMESDLVGEKVIANGKNISYRKVFEMIADSVKTERPNIALNSILGALAWRLEWLRSKVMGSSAYVTKETVENSFRTWIYENKKSIEMLNFKYTPIEKTIEETGELFLRTLQEDKKPTYLPLN